MPGLPSLEVLSQAVADELAAHERRTDALDSKAGVVLGFAGILVALSGSTLDGGWAAAGLISAAAAAILAGVAVFPRRFPTLNVLHLRNRYLTSDASFTHLKLLGLGYLGCVLILTWQALRGQPMVAPDAASLGALAALIAAAGLATGGVLLDARRARTRGEDQRSAAAG